MLWQLFAQASDVILFEPQQDNTNNTNATLIINASLLQGSSELDHGVLQDWVEQVVIALEQRLRVAETPSSAKQF